MVISGTEDIKVPAGVFRAAKIHEYDSEWGQLMGEYWYAPTMKWFVKLRVYGVRNGLVSEQQLESFKTQ